MVKEYNAKNAFVQVPITKLKRQALWISRPESHSQADHRVGESTQQLEVKIASVLGQNCNVLFYLPLFLCLSLIFKIHHV